MLCSARMAVAYAIGHRCDSLLLPCLIVYLVAQIIWRIQRLAKYLYFE